MGMEYDNPVKKELEFLSDHIDLDIYLQYVRYFPKIHPWFTTVWII